MAYLYKTVMRAENHTFDICKNRSNSRQTIIIAFPKGSSKFKTLGVIQNKTGVVAILDTCGFAPATIEKLKNKMTEDNNIPIGKSGKK